MKRAELARNLALSAGVTVLLLGLIEGGVRLAGLAPPRSLAFPDIETWESNPGPFEPNQQFVDRMVPRLPHRITINSHGFRGGPFELPKPAGTARVLCLGDSYTFGDYVNDDETFPAALQANLKRLIPERPTEVINAGVNGYTIVDEREFAEEKGFALHPDVIVLGFVMNDLADLTRRVSTRENQKTEAERMSVSLLTPIKRILRQTATYNWLFKLKAQALARAGTDPTLQALPQYHLLRPPFDEETEALFVRYASELGQLADSARQARVPLLLVLFPFYEQVARGATAVAQARIGEIAKASGVPWVDLLPAFLGQGQEAGKLFLMPRNHHPSAEGYRVAADAVGRAIAAILSGEARQP